MPISDNRGRAPWSSLTPRAPHVRVLDGQPLVVLTTPARYALCIEPDGRVAVRALTGVSPVPCFAGSRTTTPTAAQVAALADMGVPWDSGAPG